MSKNRAAMLGAPPRSSVWRKLLEVGTHESEAFHPTLVQTTPPCEPYSSFARRAGEGATFELGARKRIALVPVVVDWNRDGMSALAGELCSSLGAFAHPTRVSIERVDALEGDRSLKMLSVAHRNRSLSAARVLDVLARRAPADAALTIAFTLLPVEWTAASVSWIAAGRGRASLLALHPSSNAVERAAALARHVAAAVIGTERCTFSRCLLNEVLPRGYPHLCPLCLRKLALASGAEFDPTKRYAALLRFHRAAAPPDAGSLEVRWLAERLTAATGRVHDAGLPVASAVSRWTPPVPAAAPAPVPRTAAAASAAPAPAAASERSNAEAIVARVQRGGDARYGELQLVERFLCLGLFPAESRSLSFIERRQSAIDALRATAPPAPACAPACAPAPAHWGSSENARAARQPASARPSHARQQEQQQRQRQPAPSQQLRLQQQRPVAAACAPPVDAHAALRAVIERVRCGGAASFGELRAIHNCAGLGHKIMPPKGQCFGIKMQRQEAWEELRRQLLE